MMGPKVVNNDTTSTFWFASEVPMSPNVALHQANNAVLKHGDLMPQVSDDAQEKIDLGFGALPYVPGD